VTDDQLADQVLEPFGELLQARPQLRELILERVRGRVLQALAEARSEEAARLRAAVVTLLALVDKYVPINEIPDEMDEVRRSLP